MNKPIADLVFSLSGATLMLLCSFREGDVPVGAYFQPIRRVETPITQTVTSTVCQTTTTSCTPFGLR